MINKSSDSYKKMHNRVIESIRISYKDNYNKWVKRKPNDNEAGKLTISCLENDLYPESNHVAIIGGNIYITWEGTKKIINDKKIYWEVYDEKYEVGKVYNFKYKKDEDLVTCYVHIRYIPSENKDKNETSDSYNSYIDFLERTANILGIKNPDDILKLMPSGSGIGTCYKSEVTGSKGLSAKAMAKKRAIMNFFNYMPFMTESIDSSEVGSVDNNSIEESEHDIVTKPVTKKAGKESVNDGDDVEFESIKETLQNFIQGKNKLTKKISNKVNKWANILKTKLDNNKDRMELANSQMVLIGLLKEKTNMIKIVDGLLKSNSYSDIYEVDHIDYINEAIKLVEKTDTK